MEELLIGSRTLQPGRQLLADGQHLHIGKRALDVVSVLAQANGEIVTKDELLAAVWPGVIVEENALQVHIVALRKALGPDAHRLKTIRGVGYQLEIGANATSIGPPNDVMADTIRSADGATTSSDLAITALGGNAATTHDALAEAPRYFFTAPAPNTPPGAWIKSRPLQLALALSALVLLLLGGWAVFGGAIWPQRVPVVVRGLIATGDRTEAALATGITDELIVRLRRIPDLRIASGSANGRSPGGAFTGAHVVDGSIRRTGDRLRVTARLTDAGGEILWSQTFDRRVADLFEVQEAIAASISDALGVSLDVGANAAASGGTNNPEAFAAYLEYKTHIFDQDQGVPVAHLERALALDPDYVKALAALSTSFGIQSNFAPTRRQALALLAKMESSTARAVAANPDLWIGHMARGNFYNEQRNYAAAAASFRRVEELDNGLDPELRQSLAIYALLNGRARKALALLDSNAAVDPITRQDPTRIWALSNLGRHREAIELFEKLAASDPISVRPNANYARVSYAALGRQREASRVAQRYNLGTDALGALEADRSLPKMPPQKLQMWADQRFGKYGSMGIVSVALLAGEHGHPKLATDLLRLSKDKPGGFVINALWQPAMANVRKTDDFKELVTDLGLVRFWRESGSWPDACRPVSTLEFSCS